LMSKFQDGGHDVTSVVGFVIDCCTRDLYTALQ